jgi:hypothetical protein
VDHAIVDEAPRRGLAVLTKEQAMVGSDTWRQREIDRSQLVLRSPAELYSLRIHEASAPGGKVLPPGRWYDRPGPSRWQDMRPTEFISTGILEIIVEGRGTGSSGDRFRDSRTITLEEKLPRLFRAIELRRLYDEHRDGAAPAGGRRPPAALGSRDGRGEATV